MMEQKDGVTGVLPSLLVLCAAIYLAVLPMADTIALRNFALAGLLVLLMRQFWLSRSRRWWSGLPEQWSIYPALLWIGYLCIFPVFAEDGVGAWRSFGTVWYHSILALIAGAGLAIALRERSGLGTSFQFGVVSAVPILVHLGFVGWKMAETGSIPWNYWGRETHHADLGYTAGHVFVLLGVATFVGKYARRLLAVGLMVAALLSVVVAHSRAGLGFALLAFVLVLIVHMIASGKRLNTRHFVILGIVLVGVAAVVFFAARSDERWVRMVDRISAGFYGDALQIQCEGNAKVEQELVRQYGVGVRAEDLVRSIRDGDGARMVLLRAGFQLALEHPWGLDGSRQAYQKRLREHCPNPRAFQLAHTHNGWLDTVLALGWIGAGLYLLVLVSFLRMGLAGLRAGGEGVEWAYVLIVLSIFWILRGFTDSVYRDHQLEMQGFVLAYAAVALKLKSRPKVPAAAAGGVPEDRMGSVGTCGRISV